MAYTVYLDAGHGGYDAGATGYGRREKDDNLNLTLAVGEILQGLGVDVGYTRVEDVYDSPLRKAQIANEAGADLFVSIHRNASTYNNRYDGVQTLLYDETGLKKEIADAINQALSEVGFKNIGTEARPDLAVLRRTEMPAMLVEVGFIDTEKDNQIFDESFDEMAGAIAYAIYNTLLQNGLITGMEGMGQSSMRGGAEGDVRMRENGGMQMNTGMQSGSSRQEMSREGNVQMPESQSQQNQTPWMENRTNAQMGSQMTQGTASTMIPEYSRQAESTVWERGGMVMPVTNTDMDDVMDELEDAMEDATENARRSGCVQRCMEQCREEPEEREPFYQIQTGLFRVYQNAANMKRQLERQGYPAIIQLYKDFYAVRTGYYDTTARARQAEERLQRLGYDTLIITVK